MTVSSAKDGALAARILSPENLPPDFLSYLLDYTALNMPPVPVSSIMGAGFYSRQLDAIGTALSIASSAAETTIYSYTLGGGALGTEGAVLLRLCGDYENSSGSTRSLVIRVKYGGTTMIDNGTGSAITTDADRRAWSLDVLLSGADATNGQCCSAKFRISASAPTPTAGVGSFGDLGELGGTARGSAAEDSTLNKDLVVTIQHSASASTIAMRRDYALLTKIGH